MTCPFRYPDDDALLGPLLTAGIGRAAIHRAGRAAVCDAVLAGLARFREPAGGYRLNNLFRCLTATFPHRTPATAPHPSRCDERHPRLNQYDECAVRRERAGVRVGRRQWDGDQ